MEAVSPLDCPAPPARLFRAPDRHSDYDSIFALLLTLTALTVAVAYVDLGPLNIVVALGIAAFKATAVILYFMHVKYASRLTQLFVVLGFCWLALLLGITSTDFASRAWMAEPAGWELQPSERSH